MNPTKEADRRVRRRCPKCRKLRYGDLRHYFDTVRVFLQCGVMVDSGYGYWAIDDPEQSRKWHRRKRAKQS